MSDAETTPIEQPVPEKVPIIKKSNNKAIFIILGIILILILCFCCLGLGFLFVIPKFSNNEESERFIGIIQKYDQNIINIDNKWDNEGPGCDRTEEFNVLADGKYDKETAQPLYQDIPNIIDEEKDCYMAIRNYELESDLDIKQQLETIDCKKVDESALCVEFKELLDELISTEKEQIITVDQDYENWKEVNVCYVDSIINNYDNVQAKDLADSECERKRIDLNDKFDILDAKYDETTGKLYDLDVKYFGDNIVE